jgi:hypothetical protein
LARAGYDFATVPGFPVFSSFANIISHADGKRASIFQLYTDIYARDARTLAGRNVFRRGDMSASMAATSRAAERKTQIFQ